MKRRTLLAAAGATIAAGLAGCTTPSSGPSGAASSASSKVADVEQAKLKAAQYDYDGALSMLAGDTSPAATKAADDIKAAAAAAVPFTDLKKVPHLFWHPLVVDPTKAFAAQGVGVDGDATKLSQVDKDKIGNMQYMVTKKEFEAQLQAIYDKGYVLIQPTRLYVMDNGKMVPNPEPIKLPQGKKPIIFSQDDVNYYKRWADVGGFPAELKVAANGTVVNRYKDATGAWVEGAYDMVPIVDAFVTKHPDFSYRGDKGMLALTGYEGALGYRSSVKVYGDTPATKQAATDATKVADAIKANGWRFTSHTWHHISYQASTPEQIQADMELWLAEVGPIVGKTDLLIFAFGSDITLSITTKYDANDPKFQYLHDKCGFNYFFPIDNTSPYFSQLGDGYYRQWRVDVDGITMQKVLDNKKTALPMFFDTASVWDPQRPKPTPPIALGVK